MTAVISNTNNLTDLKDAINSVSGSTGVTASLTEDLANINLLQNEGYDIIIGDVFSTNANTFQVKTVNKNNETGELIDGTIHTLGRTTSKDSIAIAGQVLLSSSKAFSVTSEMQITTFQIMLVLYNQAFPQ